MKTSSRPLIRLLLASTFVLAFGCKPPPPPPPPPAPAPEPPPPTVGEIADKIFAEDFAANPVTATALGEHQYDGNWPDLSPQGQQAERQRIEAAMQTLGGARIANVDDDVDAEILRTALEREAFVLDVERPWATNPFAYVGLIGTGIDDLISRKFAPPEVRAASLISRLTTLPTLVEQAKASLEPQACMLPHTQVAIEQLDGLVDLVRATALERLADAPEDLRNQLGAATSPAVMALRDLQQHLRDEVLPVAAGQWRLGAENFEKKLQLTLGSDVNAASLRRAAIVEHGKVRAEMATLAAELGAEILGSRKLRRIRRRADGDPDAAVTQAVLEVLAQWHVDPETLRDAAEVNLVRLDAFVRANDIVPLDDGEVLEVIWTPPHQRGVAIAGLAAPGPLETVEKGLPSFYLVQPLPAGWDPEVTESYLREYNNFMLEILSIHEAIPGHFVQLYYGKREPSKVRRVLQSGAFVEGWAVYTEKVMVEAGYSGVGPSPDADRPDVIPPAIWTVLISPELRAKAIALHRLKFYLRTVTNAILDHSIHAGGMSREEALELMIERSFQQEGEAVGKWRRAQLGSTQLSTYFAGATAWMELRAQAEQRDGFSMSDFHAQALSHGAPPVATLPRLMGWTGEATAEESIVPSEDSPSSEDTPVDTEVGEVSAEEAAELDDVLDSLD